jgi:hypothetical protein
MGFANPTQTRFPSQGRFASQGGLTAALARIQFPPPPDRPEYPPSTLEQFGMLFLAVLLLFVLVLLALPNKLSRKVIRVAFYIGKNRQ